MNISVLYGGSSSERKISLLSGLCAAKALTALGHGVALVDIIKKPRYAFFENEVQLEKAHRSLIDEKETKTPLHPDIIPFLKHSDLVFNALHGGIGEDGRLQALLDCYGIPYTGSGPLACALSMDKARCKEVYEKNGILTPQYTVYQKSRSKTPIPPCYPCVVKPANGGSSIGVTFVHSPSALKTAVEKALSVCETVIMEQLIEGTELSVSTLCDRPLAVTKIIPKNSYYDFESKYTKSGAREITPAPLEKSLYQKALNIAYNAHISLGMRNFSRTDMILNLRNGLMYALETNAVPGLTDVSILPSAALSKGLDMKALVNLMLG